MIDLRVRVRSLYFYNLNFHNLTELWFAFGKHCLLLSLAMVFLSDIEIQN